MPGGSHTDNVIDTPATRFRFQALQSSMSSVQCPIPVPHSTVPPSAYLLDIHTQDYGQTSASFVDMSCA